MCSTMARATVAKMHTTPFSGQHTGHADISIYIGLQHNQPHNMLLMTSTVLKDHKGLQAMCFPFFP